MWLKLEKTYISHLDQHEKPCFPDNSFYIHIRIVSGERVRDHIRRCFNTVDEKLSEMEFGIDLCFVTE